MFAIKNGKVITVTGPVIENGTVVVDGGKIKAVGGPETPVPAGCGLVDASGKWVYPGLIDACSFAGIRKEPCKKDLEFSDHLDGGDLITPQHHVKDAFNPFDSVIRRIRSGGVTTCFVAPGSAGAVDGQGIAV